MPLIIDFDNDNWMPPLADALGNLLPPDIGSELRRQDLKYKEDALGAIERETDIEAIIDKTLDWIRSSYVRIFHGTRLTDDQVIKIKEMGMRPLGLTNRIEWLRATFPDLRPILTEKFVSDSIGQGSLQHRENQLHAAISLKELLNAYDYLFLGSEFDRRLLEHAGRDDLVPLLTSRGKPRIIKMAVNGGEALDAMHPFFPIEFTRENDRYPNFVRELLMEFAWLLRNPSYKRVGVDSCLLFRRSIPGHQIESVETIEDRIIA